MKIAFFGLSDILKSALAWLDTKGLPYTVFVDNGQAAKSQLKVPAEKLTILTGAPDDVGAELWSQFDLGISVGAPWRFSTSFVDGFKGKLLNLHGSQLPLYRGGNLFSWYALNRVRTGVCLLHELNDQYDSGCIVKSEEFLYPSNCRKPVDYIRVYEEKNTAFLKGFVEQFVSGKAVFNAGIQPDYLSTYWPRLQANTNGWIDWSLDGDLIERFICAFDDPYGGARTQVRGKEVVVRDVYFQPGFNHHPFQNGIVFRKSKQWLHVAVQGGELIICSLESESKSIMQDLISTGDRLMTPTEKLDGSKRRVIKGKNGLSPQMDWE
ncbi:MAG: formyltransferase family protein [Bacteroidota bacterium]